MSWLANLRILAFCRRAVRALESIAESQKIIARVAEDEWTAKHGPGKVTMASFGSFDSDASSTRWEEEQRLKRGA